MKVRSPKFKQIVFIFSPLVFIVGVGMLGCNTPVKKKEATPKNSFFSTPYTTVPLTKDSLEDWNKRIAHYVNFYVDSSREYNGAIIVAKNGQVLYESYRGWENKALGRKNNSQTAFHVASLSKPVTAAAIFRLINEGKFDLDTRVDQLIHEFPYPEITIKHLLSHRSGLDNYLYLFSQDSIWNPNQTIYNNDVVAIFAKHKPSLLFEPDSKFTYCNTNFVMLAEIISRVHGTSFPKAMKELLFDPLQMKRSFFHDQRIYPTHAAISYYSTMDTVEHTIFDATCGDKNLYCSAGDFMRFDQALHDKALIHKAQEEIIFKGYSNERPGTKNYGLGFRLKIWNPEQCLIYHTGWWHGNKALYMHLREEKVGVFLVTNKFSNSVFKGFGLSSLFGDYPYDVDYN